MENKTVSVVVSTRKTNLEYVAHIKKVFSHSKTQILMYENNGEFSLPQLYNRGLKESVNDIVVFMHDDLIIGTGNVTNILIKLFNNNPEYGIIGVAGTDNMVSGMWWQDRSSMKGQVRHKQGDKEWRNNYSEKFGDHLKEVVIVDGLFFAAHKGRILEGFDEEFKGFHFYDLPFCLSNHVKGVKVGVTTKLEITHKSIGQVNKQWEDNKILFESKYGSYLPIKLG